VPPGYEREKETSAKAQRKKPVSNNLLDLHKRRLETGEKNCAHADG
jgi:hypothetical protein